MYTLEQLAAGNTVIHRIHPMAKLIVTFAYIVTVVSFNRYEIIGLVPYLFYPSVLMALSETPYGPLLKRLAITLPFVLFAGLSNILFDTEAAAVLGGITITFGVLSCFFHSAENLPDGHGCAASGFYNDDAGYFFSDAAAQISRDHRHARHDDVSLSEHFAQRSGNDALGLPAARAR